ncbi:hypothetical protein EVAR_63081_1 [Eumeta japonica]|uniref:Uncharacterized protein n=1 Tax=Eumeta variegata TaxID=151549 RepID=A0A4C1ZVH5_EUMVA|nr:hypothetical protein EVAR_63081_1 [Eumeta japonica]
MSHFFLGSRRGLVSTIQRINRYPNGVAGARRRCANGPTAISARRNNSPARARPRPFRPYISTFQSLPSADRAGLRRHLTFYKQNVNVLYPCNNISVETIKTTSPSARVTGHRKSETRPGDNAIAYVGTAAIARDELALREAFVDVRNFVDCTRHRRPERRRIDSPLFRPPPAAVPRRRAPAPGGGPTGESEAAAAHAILVFTAFAAEPERAGPRSCTGIYIRNESANNKCLRGDGRATGTHASRCAPAPRPPAGLRGHKATRTKASAHYFAP